MEELREQMLAEQAERIARLQMRNEIQMAGLVIWGVLLLGWLIVWFIKLMRDIRRSEAMRSGEISFTCETCGHSFCVPADYLVAVATKVTFRHRGLMRALLTKALRDMEEQERPFTFLMPADEAIYTPFDFRLMGNDDEEGLADADGETLAEDYELFTEKNADYERRHIFWPEWESTPMMIRLLYLPAFVKNIGAEENQSLLVEIEDPILSENNGVFLWEFSGERSALVPVKARPEIRISIADLGSFLCGMLGPEELPGLKDAEDPETVREKLEKIRVIDGIYINETV